MPVVARFSGVLAFYFHLPVYPGSASRYHFCQSHWFSIPLEPAWVFRFLRELYLTWLLCCPDPKSSASSPSLEHRYLYWCRLGCAHSLWCVLSTGRLGSFTWILVSSICLYVQQPSCLLLEPCLSPCPACQYWFSTQLGFGEIPQVQFVRQRFWLSGS